MSLAACRMSVCGLRACWLQCLSADALGLQQVRQLRQAGVLLCLQPSQKVQGGAPSRKAVWPWYVGGGRGWRASLRSAGWSLAIAALAAGIWPLGSFLP